MRSLAEQVGPVTSPVHPRTVPAWLQPGLDVELDHPAVVLTGPVGYDKLLAWLTLARIAVTTSRGIHE